MSDTAPANAGAELPAPMRSSRALRIAGGIVGVALIAAALWFVWTQRAIIGDALERASDPRPLLIVGLFATVTGNLLLTAALIRTLISRFGRVGFWEMQALIAAASFLNYLPFRPGLIGRIAYHRKYNDIRVRDSVRVQFEAIALGGVCVVWAIIIVAATAWMPGLFWALVALPPLLLAGAIAWRRVRVWAIAGMLRYLDLLMTAARYVIAFRLIGIEIRFDSGMVLSGINLTTTLIPFLSNGLGLREWIVTVAAPLLEPGAISEAAFGTTADLINRAAELVVVTIFGLIALTWLIRVSRGLRASRVEGEEESGGHSRS